jgi:hypothetical protein
VKAIRTVKVVWSVGADDGNKKMEGGGSIGEGPCGYSEDSSNSLVVTSFPQLLYFSNRLQVLQRKEIGWTVL